MKGFKCIFSRLALFIAMAIASPSCHSVDDKAVSSQVVQQILNHYLPGSVIHRGTGSHDASSELVFKQADFNGDGRQDLVILITPVELPVNHKQIIISRPWHLTAKEVTAEAPSKPYRTSLLIVQPSESGWLAADTRVDLLVDSQGIMETPSFELLVKYKSTEDVTTCAAVFPHAVQSYDVLILTTEAGIDTCIYWNGTRFDLYQPDEIP